MLLAARDGADLDGLVAVGRCLAALGRHELLLTQAVESEASLADAVAATRARRDELAADGVTARAAAFVSRAFGPDMARLALTHDADLMVVDGREEIAVRRIHPGGAGAPARTVTLRCRAARRIGAAALRTTASPSCSPGATTTGRPRSSERGSPPARPRGSSSSASGVATAATRAGCSPRRRSRSSRSWASTSSRCSRMRGRTASWRLPARPAWPSWGCRRAGGARASAQSRRALLAAGSPTLVVHRGARPGGLAPREQLTRFTWTIAGGRLISRAGRARRGRRS